ncbi:hypothetical protein SERLA73DRAFT_78530 [Serpula lacrymans var. lacrymans S7.3]|uniref:Uncharacterized protein n=2 Tax=Serpula lacrymans var. lacrymans TaxID=341189 RepID=F8QDJ2_SERL3|nr:uncharacterized protein SERLADRAFT_411936 [Serpula lacrymans var. lacrymans S7.9]EGN93663.1 hypothetical protein SERLA73DRAFT_78530 [Serpula lacrymans var. lacrymans S7.3]EGO19039.1 hypothetical protein SERLADRAFT_411936 [Serpula lacrymans var. lacrymans S7.9]
MPPPEYCEPSMVTPRSDDTIDYLAIAPPPTPLSVSPPPPSVPAVPRGRKSRAAQQVTRDVTATVFEVVIHKNQPSKCVHTANRKTKSKKQEPKAYGPIDVNIMSPWDDFITLLLISCFKWKWLVPKNLPWLPLLTKEGFSSLVNQITMKVATPKPYIILSMNTAADSITTAPGALPPRLVQAAVQLAAPEGEDVYNWEVEDRSILKKSKLDDEIEEIVTLLQNKYRPGLCNKHHTLWCFHHCSSNLHFYMNQPRCIVWAQAIKQGDATLEKLPVGANFFKAEHAIKDCQPAHVKPTATRPTPASVEATSTPANPPISNTFSYPPNFHYNSPFSPYPINFGMLGMGLPMGIGFNGIGLPWNTTMPSTGPTLPTSPSKAHLEDNHRLSLPPVKSCSVSVFCELYGLSKSIQNGLERLGFKVGDDLDSINEN